MKATHVILVLLTLALGGCSGMRIVDSDVTSFSASTTQAVTLPVRYRFERLPSQQARATQSSALEALAQPVLEQAGLRRDDVAPDYTVQLDLRQFRDAQSPWDDARFVGAYQLYFPQPGRYGLLMRSPPLAFGVPESPYYRRELAVVVRRLADMQVVFESRAKHDGPWPDDAAILSAMLQAAMQRFPAAPAGARRVLIEIAR